MDSQLISGKKKQEWQEAFQDACPAIQLRLRRDIFGSISEPEQNKWICLLESDKRVRQVFQMQDETGWFYYAFHGYESMESSIRFLLEMGFPSQYPTLRKAASALKSAGQAQFLRGIGKVGALLDEKGIGGSETIRAWLLVLLDQEDSQVVQSATANAINVIRFAASVDSIASITHSRGRYLCINDGCFWPDLYHFRLLAATKQWRTKETLSLVGACVENMCRMQPIPNLYIYAAHQPISPGSFGLQRLTPDFERISAPDWMAWFQRMILFAQLGILSTSETMTAYYAGFKKWLDQWDGWFELPVRHAYFSNWGAYTGLMLEQDWRKKQNRIFDLSFRCLWIEAQKITAVKKLK